jgi:predicted mannosyl-3-phosphoglycerate phosphatase (HAD superfamily)
MYFIREVLGVKTIVKPENGTIIYIPFNESNTDYQQYLAWLAEGNTPEPWQPE